ncbi:uncharacterized protein C8Q71DRAFT_715628 [Rhodofomes roseus]|uniref:C2H2-type domain-containing protein n=1 Tax=Rhodofomes roseus TaxID=34475 RepID=A0ABQ8K362_9APHY|nr:uncharacterized protein C8Q71DRAFT_715628 [Rhodofomes roseus]KAH9831277.1 hypothetical protein C8Q71DRAFT_715628 [Rhodofomes roseus]
MSASRPPPPVLPPLPSILSNSAMGRDARGNSPEQQRSPTSSPYQSHAVPRPTLAPLSSLTRGSGTSGFQAVAAGLPRLPPILQVEKQQVTTSATQAASASRRRNEAHFVCPVPGCGSTFTRRFNLRGHLRSHTAERPFLCEWPGCNKGFARQHDCKRHQALHTAKAQANVCHGCGKTFSRLDALNRHRTSIVPCHGGATDSQPTAVRSDGAAECRETAEAVATAARLSPADDDWDARSTSTSRSER